MSLAFDSERIDLKAAENCAIIADSLVNGRAQAMNMESKLSALWARVEEQRLRAPAIYADIDFQTIPERFATEPDADTDLTAFDAKARAELLADQQRMEFVRAYTMLGDATADAYASLMREYGFRRLVDMLTMACDQGLDAVPDAPPELHAFINEMARVPEWLDMELVEKGARVDRNKSANLGPFIIRGAFIATFMNKYAALPMAITGTLSATTAARRVKDTATFFSTSVLPGALDRYGPGFKSAAMVRLMHSMVRANVMRRKNEWDVGVYGVPIPQVDQMPAGLISMFLLAYTMLAEGRTEFNEDERAQLELSRYRCFLLGLPEDLLADTPQGIVDLMNSRSGTLRRGFDDSTCGELLRATMAANLRDGDGFGARLHEKFERAFSKIFFLKSFMGGDKQKSASVGVPIYKKDLLLALIAALVVHGRIAFYNLAAKIPHVRDWADRRLVEKIRQQLQSYGHADFTTDAEQYRPAKGVAKAA